jgi:hypothetical protein
MIFTPLLYSEHWGTHGVPTRGLPAWAWVLIRIASHKIAPISWEPDPGPPHHGEPTAERQAIPILLAPFWASFQQQKFCSKFCTFTPLYLGIKALLKLTQKQHSLSEAFAQQTASAALLKVTPFNYKYLYLTALFSRLTEWADFSPQSSRPPAPTLFNLISSCWQHHTSFHRQDCPQPPC